MKLIVTGSHGFIGSALVAALTAGGHSVTRLVRKKNTPAEVEWDPARGMIDAAGLEGHAAVVHLAGENITGRWTRAKKMRIHDSRVNGTRLLTAALSQLSRPPQTLLAASAAGYYGDRGDELLNEESAPGAGFLADVCREWEAAASPAADRGIRVVHLRLGVVLSPAGGALQQMLTPFKLGIGGMLGSGRQYWPWIALDDVVGASLHALAHEALHGPVNLVAPQAVTNREFTRALGRVVSRPTLFRLPSFALRLAFGELADAAVLASARIEPKRLTDSGYAFKLPELEPALRQLLALGRR